MALPVKIVIPTTQRKIEVPTGLFINNEFVPSVDSNELLQYDYPPFPYLSHSKVIII